ncbi:NTP transferase domain-containing protein [Nocardioides sp.]|uniref:NTP transferase domain-containing protein n=1 Tax=Nocardioides sp. TaxID=35761 RepID=UPI0026321BAE|nr:NTP transferase domain-containing protein [Nocardioides sp.]
MSIDGPRTATAGPPPFDAIVLAGGRGSRLGGVDKGALLYDGLTLLDRALRAVAAAGRVVVVGGPVPSPEVRARFAAVGGTDVMHVVEEPAGSGPAAGVAAGVMALERAEAGESRISTVANPDLGGGEPGTRLVAVLACDVPEVESAFALLRAAGGPAIGVDADGRRQYLLALYPAAALRARVRGLSEVGRSAAEAEGAAGEAGEAGAGGEERPESVVGMSMRRLVDALPLVEVLVDAADVDTPAEAARFGITP